MPKRLVNPSEANSVHSPPSEPLVRGKLSPPHMAFEPVLSRAGEVLLRTAILAKLVTVCAPVGYGKTVVLSRLHQNLMQRGQRCLWITLDDRDVAISSILYLVQAAAIETGLLPPTSWGADKHTAGDDSRNGIDRMLHLLESFEGRTTLFIDNLSFCTDPLLPQFLERIAFNTDPALRLVLSGTERLPLDSTRARLELGAVELQALHLAFDNEATTRFLHLCGVQSDDATVQEVQKLTEGWPAAVRLVQILMAESPQAGEALARFSGDDHDVANVLTRRVLAGFDVALVTFLMEIALLREFSVELAMEVTGRSEAAEWIALLLHRNVLVFPLDRSHRWLRMHTLLRQYLLAESRRRLTRERRREILERAAQWHADRGEDIAAVEAALDAPAPVLAGQLLDRVARDVAGAQGRLSLFIRWVEQLLGAGVTLSLEAHTWYVWSLCFTLQYERSHRAIEALNHRLAEADPQGTLRGLQARLGLLRVVVYVYLDMMEPAREEARRWLAHSAKRDPLAIATVTSAAAVAELAGNDRVAARQLARQAFASITRSTSGYGHAWVSLVGACVELHDSEPLTADRLLTKARPAAVEALGEDARVVSTIDFVHARILLDLGRKEAARLKAIAGLTQAAHHGICETATLGLSACVGLWEGEEEGPLCPTSLDEIARSYPPRVQRALAVMQVHRLLVLNRHVDASNLARRQLLQFPLIAACADANSVTIHECMVGLRLHSPAMDPRHVLEQCEALLRQSGAHPKDIVTLHLLTAQIHVQAGRQRQALRSFGTAVSIAARQNHLGVFDEHGGQVVRHLLDGVTDRDLCLTLPEELALVTWLRESAGHSSEPPTTSQPIGTLAVAAPTAPLEPLTPRELQLLELISQGLSNQQIADRTTLSVTTVKWHLYNLYGKLNVKSRSSALARARSLQLLHSQ